MTHTRKLVARIGFAMLVAVLLLTGTIAGGMAFSTVHPSYDRLAWLERNPADPDAPPVVARALFADGRYLALSADGYRAGVLDRASTDQLFATVSGEAPNWKASYASGAVLGQLIDLELRGRTSRTVRVANPATNLSVPPALTRVMQLLVAADRQVAAVPFAPAGLRFWASQVNSVAGAPIDSMPTGFPLDQAASPAGVVVSGADLALLESVWRDLPNRLAPGIAQRYVKVSGVLWRIGWTLDLESVGSLAGPAATGVTP